MLGILHKYNVVIPHPVSQLLAKCPGNFERRLLGCVHYEGSEEDAEFHSFQMKDLIILHEEIQQFLDQIGNAHLIDFMVHFSMHNSQIFAQYLREIMILQQSSSPKEHAELSALDSLEIFTPVCEGATAKFSEESRRAILVSSVCNLWMIRKYAYEVLNDVLLPFLTCVVAASISDIPQCTAGHRSLPEEHPIGQSNLS